MNRRTISGVLLSFAPSAVFGAEPTPRESLLILSKAEQTLSIFNPDDSEGSGSHAFGTGPTRSSGVNRWQDGLHLELWWGHAQHVDSGRLSCPEIIAGR